MYFIYLHSYKKVHIEVFENYQRHSLRNRCKINGANGEILLTIPIIGRNQSKTKTKDIQIANQNWQKKHISNKTGTSESYHPKKNNEIKKKYKSWKS